MKITLDNKSSMFGLTVNNLKIPAMQKYLKSRHITVTFPDSTLAIIESEQTVAFNTDFQSAVTKIVLSAEKNDPVISNSPFSASNEPALSVQDNTICNKAECPNLFGANQCSWSVLNGFLWSLGAAAVATAFVALLGSSAIVAASIGLGVGLATLFAYSLFKPPTENQQEMPAVEQPNLSLP